MNTFRILIILFGITLLSGCQTPRDYRLEADDAANKIIHEKTKELFGKQWNLDIEKPSNTLRRRFFSEQGLLYAGDSSLGTDKLEPIEPWPDEQLFQLGESLDPVVVIEGGSEVKLTLLEALQIGARNSFEYQTYKEDVFRAALDLDLEKDDFRHTFSGTLTSLLSGDTTGDTDTSTLKSTGDFGVTQKLESGAELSTALAIDLANLLTSGASSLGILGDASISIPLLRGSGKHIVMESLTQAERTMVYTIYSFERFKKTFAVEVTTAYLNVLKQLDQIDNNEENYRGLIESAKRARRRAEAGIVTPIQVDQAVQNELSARNRWVNSVESYKSQLDSFKGTLGLPPDASITLDRAELERLGSYAEKFYSKSTDAENSIQGQQGVSSGEIILKAPSTADAGPFELNEKVAINLAFDNRLDFRVTRGRVFDAQRDVVIKADALGAELTFLGSAQFGQSGGGASGTADDTKVRFDKGVYSGLLTLNLPVERTSERNSYRKSIISLERAVRNVQILEDRVKLNIRNKLRDLQESRESVKIQAMSVELADKRVNMTNLYLEAGRLEMRDLLEAREDLLSAQNSLTSAVVKYRLAELEIQRDMGVLQIDENGLWREYSPKEGS